MVNEIRSEAVNERNRRSWVVDINEKLKDMPTIPQKELLSNREREKRIICKLPASIRERQPDSIYAPCMVSFGPYYYSHESCVRTQDIKEHVVLYSLWRSNKTADSYAEVLSGEYDDLDPQWQQDDEAFLKLMIYDGCFIIEILREARILREANYWGNNYDSDNPVCNMEINPNELMECYRHDMLLLENQLPLLVLSRLVAVRDDLSLSEAQEHLERHILEFIFPSVKKVPRGFPCWHVLDLCRDSLLYEPLRGDIFRIIWGKVTSVVHFDLCRICFSCDLPHQLFKFPRPLRNLFKTRSHIDHFHFNIPSAKELKNVGIGFSMSKSTSLMDISVGQRTLRLPKIYVDGATKSMFLNVIAFEQLYADIAESEVASYIYFVHSLLQDADDVKLLQLHGIIRTTLSNAEVAELFNDMAKDILRDPNTFLVRGYVEVGRKLRERFNKMSTEWQRDLWQNYLRSPWAIISLMAAFLLFAFTALQTMYTILGYYNPK